MANADNAFGFEPITPNPQARNVTSGGAFERGDALMYSGGKLVVHDFGDNLIAGVAAQGAEAADETVVMWSAADTEFKCQVNGSFVIADHVGVKRDIGGSTGAMEMVLASDHNHVTCLAHHPVAGSEDVGADAVVRVVFCEHASASAPVTS